MMLHMIERKKERGAPYFNTHARVVLPSAVADFVVFVDLKQNKKTYQRTEVKEKQSTAPLCREVREG
jgi:hypothetical protein